MMEIWEQAKYNSKIRDEQMINACIKDIKLNFESAIKNNNKELHIHIYCPNDEKYMPKALKRLGFNRRFKYHQYGSYCPTYARIKMNYWNVRKMIKSLKFYESLEV